jgi:trehalose-6-phosphate synthase
VNQTLFNDIPTAAAYFRVNEHFARQVHRLLRRNDMIWVHDYHLGSPR